MQKNAMALVDCDSFYASCESKVWDKVERKYGKNKLSAGVTGAF